MIDPRNSVHLRDSELKEWNLLIIMLDVTLLEHSISSFTYPLRIVSPCVSVCVMLDYSSNEERNKSQW